MSPEHGPLRGHLLRLGKRRYADATACYTLTGHPAPAPPGGLATYHRDLISRISRIWRGVGTRAI
ncbi:hypothetical protein ACFWOX_34805 [Streptomyces sp. NPDC058467]|uniref:hypothetical protein n=1 Tax=unclassified Streptomyces TaxID=2593676 RepID=UPI0033F18F1C